MKNMIIFDENENYNLLIDFMADALLVGTPDTLLTKINKASVKLWGYYEEELIGKSVLTLFPKEEWKKHKQEMEKAIKTGVPSRFDSFGLRKDGTTFPIELRGTLIKDKDDNVFRLVACVNDITERKKKEKELHDSEQKFKTIFDGGGDGILAADKKTKKFIFANKAMSKLTGYSIDELKSFNVSDIHPKADLPLIIKSFKAQVKNPEQTAKNIPVLRKNGEVIYCDIKNSILTLEGKELILGFFRDISERKKTEENLKKSEQKFRSVIETAGSIILVLSKDYRIIEWNHTAERIFGWKREEVLEKNYLDMFIPDKFRKGIIKDIKKVLKGKPTKDFENPVISRNGKKYHVSWNVSRLVNAKNQPTGIIAIGHDITERKLTEETLVKKTEQATFLSRMLENSSQPFLVGALDGRILSLNRAFSNLTGYSEKELLENITWNETLTPPKWREIESGIFQKLVSTGIPHRFEKEYIRKDGSIINVELLVHRKLDLNNNLESVYAFVTDISERKEAEKKLKSSIVEKETLLKEVHHRVKNNLQVISSMLNLQAGISKDPDVVDAFKETMARVRTISFVHEKLYLSEDIAHVNIKEFLTSIIKYLVRTYASGELSVETNLDIDNVVFSMEQIIPCGLIVNELVTNSLKHGFKGRTNGKVTIKLKKSSDNQIELSVSDNGVGFPMDFKIDKTKTLGFQLVNVFVNKLDGKLIIEHNKGASVRVSF